MRKWTSAAFSWGWRSWRSVHGRARPCSPGDVRIDGANGIELTDEQGITITAPAVGERTVRRFLEATGDWASTGLADAAHDLPHGGQQHHEQHLPDAALGNGGRVMSRATAC